MARRDTERDSALSRDIHQPLLEDSVLQDTDGRTPQQGQTKLAWAVELGALLQLAAPVIIQLGSQYAVTLTNQAGLRLMPKAPPSSCLLLSGLFKPQHLTCCSSLLDRLAQSLWQRQPLAPPGSTSPFTSCWVSCTDTLCRCGAACDMHCCIHLVVWHGLVLGKPSGLGVVCRAIGNFHRRSHAVLHVSPAYTSAFQKRLWLSSLPRT